MLTPLRVKVTESKPVFSQLSYGITNEKIIGYYEVTFERVVTTYDNEWKMIDFVVYKVVNEVTITLKNHTIYKEIKERQEVLNYPTINERRVT